jgi:short-subunit dehydrogenase
MTTSLAGKRVLITGAAGGIGSAVARELVKAGSTLLLVDLDTALLKRLAAETGQAAFPSDLTDPESRAALISHVQHRHGSIDALVYCAGINAFGLHDAQSDEQIDRIFRINLIAPIQLIRGLIPLLEKGKAPVIVNLGSVFGHIGFPGFSLYSASKFGLRGYGEALRRELADGPVRVVWISPRATRTSMNAGIIDSMNVELKVNYDHPERVARAVMEAIAKPGRDRVLGFPESLFARINQVFPGMVDGSLVRQLPIIRKYNLIHKESKP